jgi:AcrR family transcriptional regulator
MIDSVTRTRQHLPAAERREQLLDAAVDVMRTGGIAAATTRAVTERAGVPHGVFHYCFRSKEELFAALLDRELDASLSQAWDAVGTAADLRSGIAAALHALLDRVRTDPEYHLLTAELVDVAARTPDLAGGRRHARGGRPAHPRARAGVGVDRDRGVLAQHPRRRGGTGDGGPARGGAGGRRAVSVSLGSESARTSRRRGRTARRSAD